jgi:hypothetical protein
MERSKPDGGSWFIFPAALKKQRQENINAIKRLTVFKPKFLVSYLRPCPFRTKTHSFGFRGLGIGLPES